MGIVRNIGEWKDLARNLRDHVVNSNIQASRLRAGIEPQNSVQMSSYCVEVAA